MHFIEALEQPGEQVAVEVLPPTHKAVGSSEEAGLSAGRAGLLTEPTEEVSEYRTWVGLGGRLRAVSRLLRGHMVLETYKNASGAERHTVRFVGPRLEV